MHVEARPTLGPLRRHSSAAAGAPLDVTKTHRPDARSGRCEHDESEAFPSSDLRCTALDQQPHDGVLEYSKIHSRKVITSATSSHGVVWVPPHDPAEAEGVARLTDRAVDVFHLGA